MRSMPPAHPPLLATIIQCLFEKDFNAEDWDYAPDHVENEPCFQTQYADSNEIHWHLDTSDNQLHWSFYSFYFHAGESDEPYTDVALIEIGIATDFKSDAITVTLEMTENPHGASSETTIMMQMQLSSEQEWNNFLGAHLDPAIEDGLGLIDQMIEYWSNDETDDSEDSD